MKKFNHLLLFVEMLFIIAVFSSCANDNSISPKKSLSLEELKVEMKTKSELSWQDFKTQNADILIEKDGHTFLKSSINANGGLEMVDFNECDCSYEVIEVTKIHPVGYPKEAIDLFSSSDCSPQCNIFSGLANSFYPNCVSVPNPNCSPDIWDVPYDDESHPFKCILPTYSLFPVSLSAIPLDNTICIVTDYFDLFEIKFKISCLGVDLSMPSCAIDPERPHSVKEYISDEITITIDNSDPMDNTNDRVDIVIELKDCGCQPVVLAVIQGN